MLAPLRPQSHNRHYRPPIWKSVLKKIVENFESDINIYAIKKASLEFLYAK